MVDQNMYEKIVLCADVESKKNKFEIPRMEIT